MALCASLWYRSATGAKFTDKNNFIESDKLPDAMTAATTNPANAYTVPSVSITTTRTGASSKANELGMRNMWR